MQSHAAGNTKELCVALVQRYINCVLCVVVMSLEQLIEEVRKYPCLWNKSKEEYHNQNIRDNAWESISGEMKKKQVNTFLILILL